MSYYLERIKTLAKYWETVDPETVNLSAWKCGAFTCLAGHACDIPEFNAEGFVFGKSLSSPTYKHSFGVSACDLFFGTATLFESRNIIDPEGPDVMTDYQLAATRMREYLHKRGIQ